MTKAYLEPEEVELLEKAATNFLDRLLIRLLSRLGCRISEAVALTAQDIDFQQGIVTIQHLKARIHFSCPSCTAMLGRTHTFCPKCGAKVGEAVAQEREHRRVRALPVDSNTLEVLRDYIHRGGPVTKGGRQLIFGIGRGQAWRVVSECARRAGLPAMVNPETGKKRGISPHRLRDAFAVHAMKTEWRPLQHPCLHKQCGLRCLV